MARQQTEHRPGRALAEFRKGRKPPWSQGRLAEELGVNRVTVARWEAGLRRIDQQRVLEVSEKTGIPIVVLRPDLAQLMNL